MDNIKKNKIGLLLKEENPDVLGLVETHFKKEEGLEGRYFGYRWEGNNYRNPARGCRGLNF